MVSQTDLPSGTPLVGYKQTPAGIIPDEWRCVHVRDVATVRGGKRLPRGYALTASPTPRPYIRVIDMYPGGVRKSGLLYVPENAVPMIQRYRIYSDDIFISVAGTLGIVGVVPPELSGANLTENADRITDLKCDRDYLKYWLMSQRIQISILAIATIGAQPKLALERISAFAVALPRDPGEQRAIAAVLSDLDDLIDSMEALIAKKQAIKQAAMQKLLTGRMRLPGFVGKWKARRIDELADVDPENLPSGTDPGFLFNYISLDHVDAGRLNGYSRESFATAPSQARRVVRASDVLMSTVRPSLQGHLLFADQVPNAVCSTGFAVLRSKRHRCHPRFLFAHLFGDVVSAQVLKLIAGSNYPAINSGDVGRLWVTCPPTLDEQQAIATILSDMDAEIAVLERRLDKTRAIRQGMMQQLLTGSIRLPLPDADAKDDHSHDA